MRMGAVREVRVSFDAATEDFDIPVVIELDPAPFVADEPGPAAAERVHAAVAAMVRRGLRAQVGTQSLMSGERLVRLEMAPEAVPAELQRRDGALPEVPAAATAAEAPAAALDRLLARLAALPIEQVASDMAQTLVATRQLVGSPELREAVTRLATLMAKLEAEAGPLMAELDRVQAGMDPADARRAIDAMPEPSMPSLGRSAYNRAMAGFSGASKRLLCSGTEQA